MRKGSIVTPMKDLLQSSRTLTATKGMDGVDGLMGGSNAGVNIKAIENVSIGEPKLTTPTEEKDSVSNGDLNTPSKAGATIGKNTHIIHGPSTDMRYGK